MTEGQTQALICAQNAALREEITREIADLPQADLRGVLRMIAVWKGRAVQPDAAAVWNAAIREAAGAAWAVEGGDRWTRSAAQDAILALIDKPAHVNETPKSEHVPGDVLTTAAKGGDA